MPQYRRSWVPGGVFFFTVVTFSRQPILSGEMARSLMHDAWVVTRDRHPFDTDAVCVLPDHLHCIWRLPDGDADFSTRWREIKTLFTKGYLEKIGSGGFRNDSRKSKGEAAVWQRRFWEHTIRSQRDYTVHLDYMHFNPVKHGLVQRVKDWPWSSFHRYVSTGIYELDWGGGSACAFLNAGE